MSKVQIKGNVSGTGTVTIESPNTNSDSTITLPSGGGEMVVVAPGTAGNVITSNGTSWVSQALPASNNASALTTGIVGVNVGGTGANTLTSEAVIIGNSTSAVKFVDPGTSGNVLTSNGTAWASVAPAGTGANTQSFTSSGTWTKPSGCTMVMVLCWGGGGSGSRVQAGFAGGGGGGGELTTAMIPAVLLPSTVTVTIGAGGTSPATNNVAGNPGGATTFGTYSDAVGGYGAAVEDGGPGGGRLIGAALVGASCAAAIVNVISCGKAGIQPAGVGFPGLAGSAMLLRATTNSNITIGYYSDGASGSAGYPAYNALKGYNQTNQLPFTQFYSYGGGGGGGANSGTGAAGNGANGFVAGAGGGGAADLSTGGTGGTSSQITSFSGFTSVGGNGGSNGGAPTNGSGIGAGGGGSENQTAGNGTSGACIVYAW